MRGGVITPQRRVGIAHLAPDCGQCPHYRLLIPGGSCGASRSRFASDRCTAGEVASAAPRSRAFSPDSLPSLADCLTRSSFSCTALISRSSTTADSRRNCSSRVCFGDDTPFSCFPSASGAALASRSFSSAAFNLTSAWSTSSWNRRSLDSAAFSWFSASSRRRCSTAFRSTSWRNRAVTFLR